MWIWPRRNFSEFQMGSRFGVASDLLSAQPHNCRSNSEKETSKQHWTTFVRFWHWKGLNSRSQRSLDIESVMSTFPLYQWGSHNYKNVMKITLKKNIPMQVPVPTPLKVQIWLGPTWFQLRLHSSFEMMGFSTCCLISGALPIKNLILHLSS